MYQWNLLLLVPAVVLLASLDNNILPPSLRRSLAVAPTRKLRSEAETMPEKPVMHTFFAKLGGDMTDGDRDEIAAWRTAWESAGWRTEVLGLDDAKKHPDYDDLSAIVDALPLINYDKLCYYRWLAMASADGGWMSDYDVVPVHSAASSEAIKLAQRPTLTVYASNAGGQPVPALVSGSALEWTRVANAIVRKGPAAIDPESGHIPSDMHSLMALQGKVSFNTVGDVMRGQDVLVGGRDLKPTECGWFRDKRGVHFSHKSMMDGLNMEYKDIENQRPKLVLKWLEMYQRICLGVPSTGTDTIVLSE